MTSLDTAETHQESAETVGGGDVADNVGVARRGGDHGDGGVLDTGELRLQETEQHLEVSDGLHFHPRVVPDHVRQGGEGELPLLTVLGGEHGGGHQILVSTRNELQEVHSEPLVE